MGKGTALSSLEGASGWKKADLVNLLSTASSNAQVNKAVKLLKKFEPNPKKHIDNEAQLKNLKLKKYTTIQAYVCFRCDRVKQTNVKGAWLTSEGMKTVCNACYNNLVDRIELAQAR